MGATGKGSLFIFERKGKLKSQRKQSFQSSSRTMHQEGNWITSTLDNNRGEYLIDTWLITSSIIDNDLSQPKVKKKNQTISQISNGGEEALWSLGGWSEYLSGFS